MGKKQVREHAKILAKKYGYLPYMIERYITLWGEEETLQFLDACERPVRTAIRINTLKADIKDVVERLEEKGVRLEQIPWIPEGFWADFGEMSPGALTEHMLGEYYIQGTPSMTATRVLDPQPDEIIMDLAAAPGGKTTHIAQLQQNRGIIIAIEQDRLRIGSLESNIYRCGVTNAIVLRGDARKIKPIGITPDRILLDAPCSGEGLIPLDHSRKTSKTMPDIRFCATVEDELLHTAVDALAPGGTMVYATCSIAPEENEYIVDGILHRHPEMKIVPIDLEFGSPGITSPYGIQMNKSLALARRFLPHLHGTEGFFICKMTKEA
ncbi:MAG: RsmB/NOP family class I SAM-dependent RNA methyltransferase [Candidatus Thorarchaeota archaeon]|nr:RsmB/NOP family class I SAM-dependent RNA methyltransferase [Candidatus Thorarchaeota archaeon]